MTDARHPDFGGLKHRVALKIATAKGVQSTQDILSLYSKRLGGK
jgi:hypothetical protein